MKAESKKQVLQFGRHKCNQKTQLEGKNQTNQFKRNQQATNNKQQATSNKQQATNNKHKQQTTRKPLIDLSSIYYY